MMTSKEINEFLLRLGNTSGKTHAKTNLALRLSDPRKKKKALKEIWRYLKNESKPEIQGRD